MSSGMFDRGKKQPSLYYIIMYDGTNTLTCGIKQINTQDQDTDRGNSTDNILIYNTA